MSFHNSSQRLLVPVAMAVLLALWGASANAAAPAGCASFSAQATAQERFAAMNGSPSHDVAGLDVDRDGVACEELPGPYEGFATIGYNHKRGFFYGTASMPLLQAGNGFACLRGNQHFSEGPRLLKVYRVRPGDDRPISGSIGAEPEPASGHLVWKLERRDLPRGGYYVVYEEQQRSSPYRPSECPGFRSREVTLPAASPS